ncbi:MAG: efflux RND transporter periplasmic adaptor subunit [Gammaproteobacteria bacterium]|nr:efflux RND transporter periplasmic adaptor subunit [Gammaproteobacteria bacterium]
MGISNVRTALILSGVVILVSACDSTDTQKQAARNAPPPGVLVAEARPEQIRDTVEFIGRTVAVNDVSLNAQVSGYLQEILFEEGGEVREGELLFKIDPAIYAAQVAAAKGSVAKASAALVRADKDLARYRELLKKQSVSRQQVDQAESDQLQAAAEVQAAEASLKKAETDLSFTEIRAPIDGRIGRALVSTGNLVGPQSGELARLVELDPIYVNFSVSESDLLDVKQKRKNLTVEERGNERGKLSVALRLANRSVYPHTGEIDFLDNVVDPKTGTVTLRAKFDNPDDFLVPGLFVSTILSTEERTTELMIPQAAVQEDQAGRFVMVVAPDDTVERRKITTGRQIGANLVVTTGLNPEERVVVEGIQKVRPGMKVDAKMSPRPEDDREAAIEDRSQPAATVATDSSAHSPAAPAANENNAQEAETPLGNSGGESKGD